MPQAPPADAPLTLTTTDGQITTATPGQQITVVGTGFLPYSTATIVIYSTPTVLGTVTADATGAFRAPVTVPSTLPAGAHSLVAYGVDPAGLQHSLRLNVTVAAASAPASPSRLAFTGLAFAPVPVLIGGLGLVLAGLGLVVASRKRRRTAA